ncbi:MAG TPA: thiamine pyrophosphate-binding protein [Gemmataceae bacterium]|jgi:acetolactate synthase-1/2/3 large subunit|nr:thiamine pyrophosphate-binding protein [Gemmataceae bacterium]
MATGADLLIDCLYRQGVRVVFGMPGSHATAIYDALARHGSIRTILIRNEQAGAFAADGFARVTGQPGVICTTAGPGATNALTGIAEAWADSMPVLLLAGQVNHDRLHQECGNYHEIDLEGIFRPCTKVSITVMANDRIPGAVKEAWQALSTGRRRPAALILPQDLMAAPVANLANEDRGVARQRAVDSEVKMANGPPLVPNVQKAVDLLARAQRPILLAGGGAVWAGAGPELKALAKKLACPVITTLNGKGIVDERDPHSLGHARSFKARVALPQADLLLAVGCRFTEVFTRFRTLTFPRTIVQIDIDPGQIGMNYPAAVGIVADAKIALGQLLAALPKEAAANWRALWQQAHAAQRVRPEWLIGTLREELPENGVVFADASEMGYRMHFDFPAYAPRTFFYPSNYIALGWGLPAALGAAVALPDRPVVSLGGDGGFLMTAQELATALRYRLKVIAIVHNDAAYGAIRNIQRKQYQGRYVDTDLNNPDFVKLAEAYGMPGARAPDAEEFRRAFRAALGRTGPSLIEIPDQWRSLRA